MNAVRYGLSRIFFGGFFIRGHPYTMETISFAIDFWSKACSQFCPSLQPHVNPELKFRP
jgi:type II pantothenate kinase